MMKILAKSKIHDSKAKRLHQFKIYAVASFQIIA